MASLKKLVVSPESVNERTGVAAHVAESLRINTAVEELIIFRGSFPCGEAEEFGEDLAEITTLKELHLHDCIFQDVRTFQRIFQALNDNQTLTKIRLINNSAINWWPWPMRADQAVFVNEMLDSCSSLKSLDLYDDSNILSLQSATSIFKLLRQSELLESLVIDFLSVEDEACYILAEGLRSTTSLRLFCLGKCISKLGAEALGTAWGNNLALPLDFDLRSCHSTVIQNQAQWARSCVLLEREKLVAFGMGMNPRLGGRSGAQGVTTRSSRRMCPFYFMCNDVFKLVGEYYLRRYGHCSYDVIPFGAWRIMEELHAGGE